MSRPSVVYWNNIPSPYHVGRMAAVANAGGLNLIAWFSSYSEPGRSWTVDPTSWQFRYRILSESSFGTLRSIKSYLKLDEPVVFVTLYHEPDFLLGALAAKAASSRVAFRVLPSFTSWQPRRRTHELIKRSAFRAIDSAKVSGVEGSRRALDYGLPAERIFPVTQSIDVAHFASARTVSKGYVVDARRELGLRGFTFLYVGRIWRGKGIDSLLDAFRLVRRTVPESSLLLVGSGPDLERYRAASIDIPGVVFHDFVQVPFLPQIYALADALVFPTLGDPNGLVVEEAMAAGLPVVSSRSAGNIRYRLPDGVAGYLVTPNDPEELATAMLKLAQNPDLARRMGEVGSLLVVDRDHAAYVRDFERFVDGTLSLPPRHCGTRTSKFAYICNGNVPK